MAAATLLGLGALLMLLHVGESCDLERTVQAQTQIAIKLYFVDDGDDAIKRANLDGTDVETLVSTGLTTPQGIAVSEGKMYWTDFGNDTIKRADLDGTDVETLVSTWLNNPQGIAVSEGKMYWTDTGYRNIKRANLDGTDVEELVDWTEVTLPTIGIALEVLDLISSAPGGDFTQARLRGWRVSTQEDAVSGKVTVVLRWGLLGDAEGYEVSVLDNGLTEYSYLISQEQFLEDGLDYRFDRMPGAPIEPEDPDSDVLRFLTVQVRAYQLDEDGHYIYSLPTETQHVSFLGYDVPDPEGYDRDTGSTIGTDQSGLTKALTDVVATTGMDIDISKLLISLWVLACGVPVVAGAALGAPGIGVLGGGLAWAIGGPPLVGVPVLWAMIPLVLAMVIAAVFMRRKYAG